MVANSTFSITRWVLIGPVGVGRGDRIRGHIRRLRLAQLFCSFDDLSLQAFTVDSSASITFSSPPLSGFRPVWSRFRQALLEFFQFARAFSAGLRFASAARAAMAFSIAAWAASAGWSVAELSSFLPPGVVQGLLGGIQFGAGLVHTGLQGRPPVRCPRPLPAPVCRWRCPALLRWTTVFFQFLQFTLSSPACCAAFLACARSIAAWMGSSRRRRCRLRARSSAAFLRAARLASFSASACSSRCWRVFEANRDCSAFRAPGAGAGSRPWRRGSTAPAVYCWGRPTSRRRTRCSRTGCGVRAFSNSLPWANQNICCGSRLAGQASAHMPQRIQACAGGGVGNSCAVGASRQLVVLTTGTVAGHGKTHHGSAHDQAVVFCRR